MVKSLSKGNVYHIIAGDAWVGSEDLQGEYEYTATFDKNKLYPGTYTIDNLWMGTKSGEYLDLRPDALFFKVEPGGPYLKRTLAAHAGIIYEVPEWSLRKIAFSVK